MKALLINALLHLLAALPLRLAQGVGSTLGWLLGQLQGDMGRITRINLQRCLPELPARERDRLARASLVETGRTFAELGAMWLWRPERLLARVREVRGWELLEAAMAAGRGIIFLSPHLGAWELGSLYVARHYPVTALYRPLRVPGLDALVRTARERTGATLMPTDASGVRSLYRALERGETVGILPDQDPGRGAGVFAPFFGHPAKTMVLVSRLASRSGAAVLICVPERLPRGRGFCLNFTPAPAEVSAADLNRSVAAVNAGVEAWVRRLPAQYLWSYKRFKSRPEGESRWY